MKNIDFKKIIIYILCITIVIVLVPYLLVPILLLTLLVIIVKIIGKEITNENKTKIDFAKEKDYYRELIKEYSIAELAFVDNLGIDEKIVAICTLLKLKLNKIISIEKNNIEIVKNAINDLNESEKFLLDNLKDGKIVISSSGYLEQIAIKEAEKDSLITNSKDNSSKINKKKWELIIIFVLFNIVMLSILFFLNIKENIMIIYFLLVLGLSIFMIIYINIYKFFLKVSYKRTDKGESINIKMEGLKEFIKDFSNLNEVDNHALTLWEEYLIYSCLFGINNEIIKDMSELVKIKTIEFESNI